VASDIDVVLGLGTGEGGDDALYDQAVAIVAKDRKCSTSYIQRKLGIGYNKAARSWWSRWRNRGVVTPANHVGKRASSGATTAMISAAMLPRWRRLGPDWTRIFTDRLAAGADLVGATACDLKLDSDLGRLFQAHHGRRARLLHIQSTAYALSRAGLARLIGAGFYAIPETYGKLDIIADFEIRMTDLILQGGGRVECLMPILAGVDFHAPDVPRFSTSDFGNLIGPEDFLGRAPDPAETLFAKVNLRDQDPALLAARTYGALALNLPDRRRDWPPAVDLMQRCRAEAEAAAARHLAAEDSRLWRRFLRLRRGIERMWQRHLRG
jgi:hypothetical protein